MNTSAMSRPRRVLVADDDAGIRLLMSASLTRKGYEVAVAAGVKEAQEAFSKALSEERHFDAVVSDYLMPDGTGLELLEWIKDRDAALAAIFVTSVNERDLVKKSLQTGACDFLDKPVQLPMLAAAVAQAVDRTAHQRSLRAAESSVQEVGRLQQVMLGANLEGFPGAMEICWHPQHAAGGDLVNVFRVGPDRLLVVVADVSGHDLKAGFISAFFQGVVHGMIDHGLPVSGLFSYFNRFLIHEWGRRRQSEPSVCDVETSIAVCAFDINLASKSLAVLNSGFPIPVVTDGTGETTSHCGDSASHPLGWFEDSAPTEFEYRFVHGGYTYAWTDGLEDLAGKLGVGPLALAESLLQARRKRVVPAFLKESGDDVLLVRLDLGSLAGVGDGWVPLLYEQHFDGARQRIDTMQAQWERSIELAIPEIAEDTLFDILLCSREAVLNGVTHGCASCPERPCTYVVAFHPTDGVLRVSVVDPGPGHDFNWAEHEKTAGERMLDAHRGLILMNRLPDRTTMSRRGTSIVMEFRVRPDAQKAAAA